MNRGDLYYHKALNIYLLFQSEPIVDNALTIIRVKFLAMRRNTIIQYEDISFEFFEDIQQNSVKANIETSDISINIKAKLKLLGVI